MATSSPVRHAWRVLIGLLAIVAVLFGVNALGVYVFQKSSWVPELALDLQGGTQIILAAETPDGADPSGEQLAQAVTIIRQRIDASGVGEASVTTEGGRNIVVQIPGEADEEPDEEAAGNDKRPGASVQKIHRSHTRNVRGRLLWATLSVILDGSTRKRRG